MGVLLYLNEKALSPLKGNNAFSFVLMSRRAFTRFICSISYSSE